MEQALKAGPDADHSKQADIKVDSKTERKPAKTVDVGRQSNTDQKTASRSGSHPTKA